MLNRRDFLAAMGLMAVASCRRGPPGGDSAAGMLASGVGAGKLDRIGIQLYSVRSEMARDLPGTLARLAEIGYKEVEFAGYFGRSPAEIKQILERNQLTAPSTHIPIELIARNWDRALDDAAAAGHRWVTIPWMPVERRGAAENWRAIGAEFNRAAEQARSRGLRFAYHNHDFEFERVGGVVPFDVLLESTDPSLVFFELDVYWITKPGFSAQEYIRKHPARFTMLHIKDSAGPPDHKQTDVGAGTIDFGAILRLDAGQRHAIEHVFVEHDQPPDPLAFAKKSFDHLKALTF